MKETMGLTRGLAAYLCSLDASKFRESVIDVTKMCIEDFVGVAIAGSVKRESEIWKKYYAEKITAVQASTLQKGFVGMTVEQAVALNAVFGHVMDMDDVNNASIAHLAVITIPTALALGQELEKSGMDIITAVVAGYEAGSRIGEAINPSSYKYWHTTGVVGAFSSGTTAAKLLELNEEQMLNCFGTAGTQSAGLWEFLASGSMSKVVHTANSNLCGLRSAELAQLGFTGAPTILEGDRGFVHALASEAHLESLTKDFGKKLRIEENSFKPYACCRHTHSANYCIEKILSSQRIHPEDILSITDETYSTAVQTTNNPYPENPYAAKFSLQFCIAAAIVLRDLSDKAFTVENMNDPRIRSLMSKIRVTVNRDLDEEFRADPCRWAHRLTICLKNGETIMEQIDYPIGDFKNPFDWDMADQKFTSLVENIIGAESTHKLLDRLHRLETIQNIKDIFKDL